MKQKAIVIGAGIVGLATARALSLKGYDVTVIERSPKASGASVRNFGMIWPIGQPDGELYDAAIRSAEIWKEIADKGFISLSPSGSLHVAYEENEWQVLQELYTSFNDNGRPVKILSASGIASSFPAVRSKGLLGGLYSGSEMIVDPREAIAALPQYLSQTFGVGFIWNSLVSEIKSGTVKYGTQSMDAELIVVCGGQDFETLYPELYNSSPITKCKLQMMRFEPPVADWQLGTAICGGLSLIHYASFATALSLPVLKKRFREELPEYLENGIHVMVAQSANGELTVGDSHEYGLDISPFDRVRINELIIQYLGQFIHCEDWQPVQTWHGVYPKLTDGSAYLFINPESQVYILNGVGGAGMTLSFGLAEKIFSSI